MLIQAPKSDQHVQKPVAHTSSEPFKVQTFPYDLLWNMGRDHIEKPAHLFALALTSHDMWDLLRLELYRTDIIYARDQVQGRGATVVQDNTALVWSIMNHKTERAQGIIKLASKLWPEYINVRKADGLTAVEACALRGNVSILQTLLASEDCDLKGAANITSAIPDLYAILTKPLYLFHPSCRTSCCNKDRPRCAYNINALGISVASNQAEVTKALIKHAGPDVWVVHAFHGFQSTHVAVMVDSVSSLDMLLKAGYEASVGSDCLRGATAHHLAAAKADTELISTIRTYMDRLGEAQRIAQITKMDKIHRMAIHYAAIHDNLGNYLGLFGAKLSPARLEQLTREYNVH